MNRDILDANMVGGNHSSSCTLIISCALATKAVATTGLSVVNYDYYGVFPLIGKLVNVRKASPTQVSGPMPP